MYDGRTTTRSLGYVDVGDGFWRRNILVTKSFGDKPCLNLSQIFLMPTDVTAIDLLAVLFDFKPNYMYNIQQQN